MANDSNHIASMHSIVTRLKGEHRILAGYLLGSAVSNRMRPDSDLDIALLAYQGKTLSQQDLFDLAADLTTLAGRQVDLGVLSSQNLIYASEALLKGQRFYCTEPHQTDLEASTLLGMAMEFHSERREIVDAYTA